MLRDNIKRLARRTRCTTKKKCSLENLLAIYIDYHNTRLIPEVAVRDGRWNFDQLLELADFLTTNQQPSTSLPLPLSVTEPQDSTSLLSALVPSTIGKSVSFLIVRLVASRTSGSSPPEFSCHL